MILTRSQMSEPFPEFMGSNAAEQCLRIHGTQFELSKKAVH